MDNARMVGFPGVLLVSLFYDFYKFMDWGMTGTWYWPHYIVFRIDWWVVKNLFGTLDTNYKENGLAARPYILKRATFAFYVYPKC